MTNEVKTEDSFEKTMELMEEEDIDLSDVIPTMNVQPPMIVEEEKPCIVKDDVLLGLYDEILENCREDRKLASEMRADFLNMAVNDGDSSPATKEAVVNLMKIESEAAEKMTKVADLMTRIKLKDKDTYKPYYNAHQTNNVRIESSKRDLIKAIQKAKKQKGNE